MGSFHVVAIDQGSVLWVLRDVCGSLLLSPTLEPQKAQTPESVKVQRPHVCKAGTNTSGYELAVSIAFSVRFRGCSQSHG